MPLTPNSYTAASSDDEYDNDGNWSLFHVPNSSELAIINGTLLGGGQQISDHGNTSQPGAIQITNGNASTFDLNSTHCIGNCELDEGAQTVFIYDAASFTNSSQSLHIQNLTGTVSASNTQDNLVIPFSIGTINIDAVREFDWTFIGGTINVSGSLGDVNIGAGGVTLGADITINFLGTGSTLTAFTMNDGNQYATQLSGTKAIGSTVTGTYDQQVLPLGGSIVDDADMNLGNYPDAGAAAGVDGTYSFKVVQDAIDDGFNYGSLHLHDEEGARDVGLTGFTPVPPSGGGSGEQLDNSGLLLRGVGSQ